MKKYIVITGGQTYNKGAQAMTYITVNEMKRRYPECSIVVVSSRDSKRNQSDLNNFRFEIIPSPSIKKFARIALLTKIGRGLLFKCGIGMTDSLRKYVAIMKDCAAVIDISGYALGSEWGNSSAIVYCQSITVAKEFNVPVYLMPQSFGPFCFDGLYGNLTKRIIQTTLSYPRYIMAREQQGYDAIRSLISNSNLIKQNDIVLQNTGIDLKNVLKHPKENTTIDIDENSVAIIPNLQGFKRCNSELFLNVYKALTLKLLSWGRSVYLIYHSAEDQQLCGKIKDMFPKNDRVVFLNEELSCLEFDNLVSKFDYIIASRFHSVVHAYRNSVPCIIIGWATKYDELSKSVNQDKYQVNIKELNEESLMRMLDIMEKSYMNERTVIKKRIIDIQKENVFDKIKL